MNTAFSKVGYYIIERRAIAEAISERAATVSIIEFLRRAKRKDIGNKMLVYGLDEAARLWEETEDFSRYLRDRLRYLAGTIFAKGCTISFVVEGRIQGEAKPTVRQHDVQIDLAGIFGADRLEKLGETCFYSTPNIP